MLQLAVELYEAGKLLTEPSPVQESSAVPTAMPARDNRGNPVIVLAWLGALPLLLWLCGMTVGVAVYCALYLRRHAGESLLFSLSFAVLLGAVVQLLFGTLMQVWHYPGLIFSWLS